MVDTSCIGCRHHRVSNKLMNTHACLYILNTGKKRPCPSGKGCTVRESRRESREKRRSLKWAGKVKP